jgi:beta-phosphoglucomutase-like phosphatase (HAD superfamily)
VSTRESPDLDALARHWWVAFATARSALDVVGPILDGPELSGRSRRIVEERGAVAGLLQAITRDQHADSWFVDWFSTPTVTSGMLGLPGDVTACVFDLDGVLTTSSAVHASAWSESLNSFLSERARRTRREFVPFDRSDYQRSIAGRPRLEGVRALLASRGISLPEGNPDDPPGTDTVHGLANRKSEAFRRRLDRDGVSAFAGSRTYLEVAQMIGLLVAVVSASTSTTTILERAGLSQLIERRVDGTAIEAEHLRPKPAPDTLLSACRRLDVEPRRAAAFETTPAGVVAAREADFRLVIGVDRNGHSGALRASDPDLVVSDLADLLDRGGWA